MYVGHQAKNDLRVLHFLVGPVIVYGTHDFFPQKNNFKIRSYITIYIFENYFVKIFLVFNNKQYQNRI